MVKRYIVGVVVSVATFVALQAVSCVAESNKRILPRIVPVPSPLPNLPEPKRRPFRPNRGEVEATGYTGQARVGSGDVSPDGSESLLCDMPNDRQRRNTRGTDGLGLCVWASMSHSGDWQDEPLFAAMHKYMERHPGGGYPSKVDDYLRRASNELGYPMPNYVHVQQMDYDILKLASKNRLMPCGTYGHSPTGRYNGRFINHMISLPHCTDDWVCVLDNNYPGTSKLEWMKPTDYMRASKANGQSGFNGNPWFIVLLTDGPPPPPKR